MHACKEGEASIVPVRTQRLASDFNQRQSKGLSVMVDCAC
jgi:hypothetical protein